MNLILEKVSDNFVKVEHHKVNEDMRSAIVDRDHATNKRNSRTNNGGIDFDFLMALVLLFEKVTNLLNTCGNRLHSNDLMNMLF